MESREEIERDIGKPDLEFDARGMRCPMPVIKARKYLDQLKTGQILLILADDPGAKKDFPAFCSQTGHELIASQEENGVFKFYIRKR